MNGMLRGIFKNNLKKGSFLSFALMLGVFPLQTDASVFSFLQTSEGATSPTAVSSQKMKILEAPASPDMSAIGGGDIVTDESALIPDSAPLPLFDTVPLSVQKKQTEPDAGAISIYKVQKGDSISEIADKFGVSVNTILWANNIKKSESIRVGDTLVILPVTGVQYTVKKGDTLKAIAKKMKADADEIASYNGLPESGGLVAGTKIIIPDGEIVAPPAQKEKTVAVAPKIQAPVPEQKSEQSTSSAADTTTTNGTDSDAGSSEPVPSVDQNTPPTTTSPNFIRPIAEGVGRKSQGLHGFNGVDIAAPIGTPIRATQKGVVIVSRDSGYNGGYGKYVVIQHDGGVQTLYAHMTKALAVVGATVEQGDTIGLVGSTGHSTGPHVHYEVRGAKNNCAVGCQ
jgi:murein DD-endopeptidase MepM/ murein hydrolase activator NlpD